MIDWFKLAMAGYFMLTVGFGTAGYAIGDSDRKAAIVFGTLWPLTLAIIAVIVVLVPVVMFFIVIAIIFMTPTWIVAAWRRRYNGPKVPEAPRAPLTKSK